MNTIRILMLLVFSAVGLKFYWSMLTLVELQDSLVLLAASIFAGLALSTLVSTPGYLLERSGHQKYILIYMSSLYVGFLYVIEPSGQFIDSLKANDNATWPVLLIGSMIAFIIGSEASEIGPVQSVQVIEAETHYSANSHSD